MKLRLISASAGLTALVTTAAMLVAAPTASAAAIPPYEPDAYSLGSLSLYDASGNVVTGGSLSDSPIAKYAVASGTTTDSGTTKFAHLALATPDGTTLTNNWVPDQLGADTNYPVSGSGVPAVVSGAGATTPVSTGSAGDLSLTTHIASFPNAQPSSSAYYNLYQLRLYTPSTSAMTPAAKYFSVDLLVTGSTWSLVYPASKTSTSVSAITSNPASPATVGATVTLSTTVTPANTAGTVTWYDGTTALPGGTYTQASGAASIVLTPGVGSHSYTAQFAPTDTATIAASTSVALPYTVNAVATGVAAITANPVSPVTSGASVILSTTVSAADSTHPAGTVTWYDGASALTGGTFDATTGAARITLAPAAGSHSYTARFAPTMTATYGASTSAVLSYMVFTAPSVNGAHVGLVSTCNPGAWNHAGSSSYAWYLDASARPFATGMSTGRIPAAYVGHTVTCRVTVSSTGNTPVSAVSARVRVLPGAAVRSVRHPLIVGGVVVHRVLTARVGRVLSAYAGTWTATPVAPTVSRYLFVWKAGSTIVSRSAAYRPTRAFRGRYLVLYVYAVRGGFATGLAASIRAKIA